MWHCIRLERTSALSSGKVRARCCAQAHVPWCEGGIASRSRDFELNESSNETPNGGEGQCRSYAAAAVIATSIAPDRNRKACLLQSITSFARCASYASYASKWRRSKVLLRTIAHDVRRLEDTALSSSSEEASRARASANTKTPRHEEHKQHFVLLEHLGEIMTLMTFLVRVACEPRPSRGHLSANLRHTLCSWPHPKSTHMYAYTMRRAISL